MVDPQQYEIWQAMHADCPPHAECCVLVDDIEINHKVRTAARLLGISPEAFMHMAVAERLRAS